MAHHMLAATLCLHDSTPLARSMAAREPPSPLLLSCCAILWQPHCRTGWWCPPTGSPASSNSQARGHGTPQASPISLPSIGCWHIKLLDPKVTPMIVWVKVPSARSIPFPVVIFSFYCIFFGLREENWQLFLFCVFLRMRTSGVFFSLDYVSF